MITVALDAMGGDNAPYEMIKGAIDAVNSNDNVKVILVGREEIINGELAKATYPKDRIEVVNATEVIETAEPPVMAIRTKKNSSLYLALKLVHEGKADAFVSSGSTGAVLVGAQLLVGTIKGVRRAPLAPVLPTTNGATLLIDCGANVDARSEHLVQFAKMGSIYMENAMGIKNPRVAIINVGAEEEKGNALVKETFPLLKACKDINFIGSIESREIPLGYADVVVTEAFTGNAVLKMYEGVGKAMLLALTDTFKSNLGTKIAYLLVKKKLKANLKKFDATEYGGAPMLGLKGLVVKSHGNAKAKEIKNAIMQCVTFTEQDISGKIKASLDAAQE